MRRSSTDTSDLYGKDIAMHSPQFVSVSSLPFLPLATSHRYTAGSSADSDSVQRRNWVASFSARMMSLKPTMDSGDASVLAESLWEDLAHYDAALAAEIEFESDLDA